MKISALVAILKKLANFVFVHCVKTLPNLLSSCPKIIVQMLQKLLRFLVSELKFVNSDKKKSGFPVFKKKANQSLLS